MPMYTYICDKCKKNFEFILSMNDDKPTVCECGGELNRNWSEVQIDTASEKRDPKSSNFWKNGKSSSQIADALSGNSSPY